MDSIVVLSSDDEDFIDLISDDDSEDVHFERNIELAKQLSLQECWKTEMCSSAELPYALTMGCPVPKKKIKLEDCRSRKDGAPSTSQSRHNPATPKIPGALRNRLKLSIKKEPKWETVTVSSDDDDELPDLDSSDHRKSYAGISIDGAVNLPLSNTIKQEKLLKPLCQLDRFKKKMSPFVNLGPKLIIKDNLIKRSSASYLHSYQVLSDSGEEEEDLPAFSQEVGISSQKSCVKKERHFLDLFDSDNSNESCEEDSLLVSKEAAGSAVCDISTIGGSAKCDDIPIGGSTVEHSEDNWDLRSIFSAEYSDDEDRELIVFLDSDDDQNELEEKDIIGPPKDSDFVCDSEESSPESDSDSDYDDHSEDYQEKASKICSRRIMCQTQNPVTFACDEMVIETQLPDVEYREVQKNGSIVEREPYLLWADAVPSIRHLPSSVSSSVRNRVFRFSTKQVNLVETCSDDDSRFSSTALELIQNFTTSHQEPTDEIYNYLLRDILLKSQSRKVAFDAYQLLKTIQGMHPPCRSVPFSWDDIEDIMKELCHRRPLVDNVERLRLTLALEYCVSMIEAELLSHDLKRVKNMRRSVAHKWLSPSECFGHIKSCIDWMSVVIGSGEYDEIVSSFLRLHLSPLGAVPGGSTSPAARRESKPEKVGPDEVPKVLPQLQKLLAISLVVSPNPVEAARRISRELLSMYKYSLSGMFPKRLLLDTMKSHLLRVTLLQRILEDLSEEVLCGDAHISIADILNTYFLCTPPDNSSMTPPPTPSDDGYEPEFSQHSPEGCQELVMLLSALLESYIAMETGKLDFPMSRPAGDWKPVSLSDADRKSLGTLPQALDDLRKRLGVDLLQPRVEVYLAKMSMLVDQFC